MGFLALFLNDFSQSKSSECSKRWEHGWPSGSFNKWPVNSFAGAEVLKPLKSPYKEMITEYIRLPPPPPPQKQKQKQTQPPGTEEEESHQPGKALWHELD